MQFCCLVTNYLFNEFIFNSNAQTKTEVKFFYLNQHIATKNSSNCNEQSHYLWFTQLTHHSNKFLRIYQTNHLNLTMNYTLRVANCCKHLFYLIFYIEMLSRNLLKFQDLSSSTQFMLIHT